MRNTITHIAQILQRTITFPSSNKYLSDKRNLYMQMSSIFSVVCFQIKGLNMEIAYALPNSC